MHKSIYLLLTKRFILDSLLDTETFNSGEIHEPKAERVSFAKTGLDR